MKILTVKLLFGVALFSFSSNTFANDKNYLFFLETGIGQYNTPQPSYLGTQIGASQNNFGFVKPEKKSLFYSTKLGLEYSLSKFNDLFIKTNLEYGASNNQNRFSSLDPNGDNLLIPGVGVGASGAGFFLPGPNNQISNAVYKLDYNSFNTDVFIEKKIISNNDSFVLKPFLGISYRETNTENSFQGDIDFFVRQFRYETDIKVRSANPQIGFDTEYKLHPKLRLLSGIYYSYNINWGKGTDKLDFTGFDRQTADMRNNDNTHSYGINLGIQYDLNKSLSFGVNSQYHRIGNAPQVRARDGVSRSDFKYDNADLFLARAVLKYKF